MSFWKFLLVLLIILLAGLLQNTDFLTVAGVKPNLLLAVLIAASFFIEEAAIYILLVLISAILLKFNAGLEPESVAFALVALAGGLIGKRLSWLPIFNNLALVGAGTIIFYVLTAPAYFVSNFTGFGIELIYNLALSIILFKSLEVCLKTSSMLKT